MEKIKTKAQPNKLNKKKTTIQITYPAPYSNMSWSPDVQPVLMKNKVAGSSSLFHRPKKLRVSPRAWSQEFSSERPDPTAPHLKYGVFRNRHAVAPKPPLAPKVDKNLKMKRVPSPMKRIKPASPRIRIPKCAAKERISSVTVIKPAANVAVRPEFPLQFVFRNHKSYSKMLGFSEVLHTDIKPWKTGAISPSFCPTPAFRGLSRKTLTPTKFRSKEVAQ